MLGAALLVVAGFAALYQGGNALLSGASGLARQLGIPPLVVGLTVVAFATSSPELAVSILAAMDGAPDIAVGNVLGSNIFNSLVAVGAIALISPLLIPSDLFKRELPLGIAVTAVAGILAWTDGGLSRLEGGILLATLIGYLGFVVRGARREAPADPPEQLPSDPDAEPEAELDMPAAAMAVAGSLGAAALAFEPVLLALPAASSLTLANARFYTRQPGFIVRLLAVLFGLGLLVAGSDALVDGARTIALAAGVSEATVGLTVVAIGTSAPELATAVVAARRGDHEIGVGNALGSNLFNILGVLGIAALITPVTVAPSFFGLDFWVATGSVVALFGFILVGRRIGRIAGGVMVGAWLVYTGWLVWADMGIAAG
ncbi:MAG: calcium/sodium antiporter [Proteobacteria bacterium]|nr:calcium/sodium antiporter [Pseudomonadota bacterium]MCP4920278.1 calcium/sodium antiporter [Pseudomonadota bacterium]